MNFSQKLGMFCLIVVTLLYLYFAFFNTEGFEGFKFNHKEKNSVYYNREAENINPEENQEEASGKKEVKNVKIYITDSKGNLRSVNRKCDENVEKSCFEFAIKELISAPTRWEKSKGLSSEIPQDTKILSIREGSKNIFIDLSSGFESGGGAESTYIRVHQLIKTANSNTKLPVYLYINGRQVDMIGGEGVMIKQPLSERSLDE